MLGGGVALWSAAGFFLSGPVDRAVCGALCRTRLNERPVPCELCIAPQPGTQLAIDRHAPYLSGHTNRYPSPVR